MDTHQADTEPVPGGQQKEIQTQTAPADEPAKEKESKTTTLLGEGNQSKNFFWDQAITVLASAMLALTVLEVLSSIRGEAVQCLTPENYTRDQAAFINSYCTQFIRRADFFLFMLVIQAVLVYGPQFLWNTIYFGKFRYFSALALSLDRHRDRKTGEFDPKNLVIVRSLMETFGSTILMYITYLLKLAAQLAVAMTFIVICATVFNEYTPAFDCPDNGSLHLINDSWPLDEQIVCVLSSLNLLYAVWWANFVLLIGTVVVSVYGLIWCVIFNHEVELNWEHVALFALQSGIQPSFYRPPKWIERWFTKKYFYRYCIRSNLDFLFLRLYRDDVGRARVLREVLIADKLEKEEQRLLERLCFLHDTKSTDPHEHRFTCQEDAGERATEGVNLGSTLERVLCSFLTSSLLNLDYIKAVDISFGSCGFKMMIGTMRWEDCDSVVSVNFDPHYVNQDHPVNEIVFHSVVRTIRTSSTIFSKKKELVYKLRNEIAKSFLEYDSRKSSDEFHEKVEHHRRNKYNPTYERANIVVVGPIPKEKANKVQSQREKSQKVIAVHWMLRMILVSHRFVDDTFYLLVVKPLTVNGHSVDFEDFDPNGPYEGGEARRMAQFEQCAYFIAKPPSTNTFSAERPPPSSSTVEVNCGSSRCTFDIRVYKGKLHEPSAPVT